MRLIRFAAGGRVKYGVLGDDVISGLSMSPFVRFRRSSESLQLDGSTEIVGSLGALGANISAIAAIGNPTRLYGLGNGLTENDEVDSPNLYSINIETGLATMIGPLGMPDPVDPYNEGGLAFAGGYGYDDSR